MTVEHAPWKVMIVDDESAFRTIAARHLNDLTFAGRYVEPLLAASGIEARQFLREHDDIAVILLDVMMESPETGLDLVRHIRETMGNHAVRIILASSLFARNSAEATVATYDVSDAVDKADVLDVRLRSMVIKALRNYRDILRVTDSLRAETGTMDADDEVAEECDRMLESCLATASGTPRAGALSGLVGVYDPGSLKLVTGSGDFADYRVADITADPYQTTIFDMLSCVGDLRPVVTSDSYTAAFTPQGGPACVIHIAQAGGLVPRTLELLRLVAPNLVASISCILAADNGLSRDIETMSTIHALVSTRSRETGKHIRRVGLTAAHLARLAGLDEGEAETIGYAAQLHDVGKVGVPDDILHKPGHLTEMEYKLMMIHTRLGHRILSANRSELFSVAATIALSHHERWDGRGYPSALSGERIPLSGRIVALCDVFDALTHERSYRRAMPIKRAVAIIDEERGRAFDPRLVDLFLNNIDAYLALGNSVNDSAPVPRAEEGYKQTWAAVSG